METKNKRSLRKTPDEPVICFIISSDEEEYASPENIPTNFHEGVYKSIINDKEPIITRTTEPPMEVRIEGSGVNITELLDSPEIEKALLQCRAVRIGSYTVFPKEKVTLSEYGLKLIISALNNEQVTLKILRTDIVKVLAHFGEQLPVLFFYLTNEGGVKVRNALKMPHNPESIYFDPASNVDMHRRITLLPYKISDDARLFIKSVYDRLFLLDELSAIEANDILVRSVPKEMSTQITPKKKNLLCQSMATAPVDQNLQIIMIYPPAPAEERIAITIDDYSSLGKDQFLNDVIIDFYLKWFFLNKLSPEMQKKTHIFSSVFYNRLTTRVSGGLNKNQDDLKLSIAKKRHSRVKDWTKTVDLFSKEFIIIPINECSHWFLAIIWFPGLSQSVKMCDNTPVVISPKKNVESQSSAIEISDEDDEAYADDDKFEPNKSYYMIVDKIMDEPELIYEGTPWVTSSAKVDTEDPIKQPYILIFDSLGESSKIRVYATLLEYLQVEYSLKHDGSEQYFFKDTVCLTAPNVPHQTNVTDSGIYILQYIEAFLENPIINSQIPLRILKEWFPTNIVSLKRYEIQQLLHKLMEEQNIDFSRLNLPKLNLNPDRTDVFVDYFDDGQDKREIGNELEEYIELKEMEDEEYHFDVAEEEEI